MGAALAAIEKMEQAGRYVSSLSELLRNKAMPMPVGLKTTQYAICIEEVYADSVGDFQNMLVKAVCAIPTHRGKSLVFEGDARITGDNGVGTQGRLELIAPVEERLGREGSIVFREGTSLTFDCDGFRSVDAQLAFILKSDNIYSVDSDGRDLGLLMFEAQTQFTDIEDFTLAIDADCRFCIRRLDGYVFSLGNLVLDHSSSATPTVARFPDGYFGGADADESRKSWQGVAVSKAEVVLPDYMASEEADGRRVRPELGLEDVIIDGSGFSCRAEAANVIDDGTVDQQSWDMSVNDFALAIDRSTVRGVGFGGKVNIPPLGENSMLDYVAEYDVEQQMFVLHSSLGKSLDFPMLCAKLTLDETSTVSLQMGKEGIRPTINANGLLRVDATVGKGAEGGTLTLPDLRFEGMVISPDRFDLGVASLTGKMETPSLAGFRLTLSDIETVRSGDGHGIRLNAAVALNDMFKGAAGLAVYGDEKLWKFNKVEVDKIHVEYDSRAFSINGGVEFRDGDDVYGKGFRGDLDFKLIDKFKLKAVGVFGRKDGYRYFLTDVLFETSPASGITVPPALSFYGFGGGLYRHMRQSTGASQSDFGKSLSGVCYKPDGDVGMGFLSRAKFSLIGSPSLLDADVSFEMQFNKNWGVNFVQLRGEATMLSAAQQTKMIDGLRRDLEKVEGASGDIVEFDKRSLDTKPARDGALTATVGMKFDMENDVFSADMKAYLDVAGVLKGRGAGNCMGWASSYFARDSWYTYIGTPQERLGVSLLGIAEAGGYFMVGDDVPELPEIPAEVRRSLSASYLNKLAVRDDGGRLMAGKGLAFGADLSVKLDAELRPFYAKLGVGMGTEMLLKQYGEAAHCKGRTGRIGIDGWYAQAQAWAWVSAAIGMKVRLFRKTRKFDILSGDMAAFLRGAGPNPVYFTGAVGGRFNILGGLVKGHCSFDFTVGEKCEVVGGSPFGEDVIAQLTPDGGSGEVNVFVAPQLVLNIPADEKMPVEDEDGRKETYRIAVADFSVTNVETGAKAVCTTAKSDDGRILTFELDEPLESRKQYKVYAKVSFERLDGEKWVPVPDGDGEPYYEERSAEFTSGERPDYILPEHVLYAYPADRQYNFLSGEHPEAYVMTSQNYSYLFTSGRPEGFEQKAQFSTFDGRTMDAPFTYKVLDGGRGAKFEVDIPLGGLSLAQDQVYNMSIVNVPRRTVETDENIVTKESKVESTAGSDITETRYEAEGDLALLEQTEIYSVDFRTSSHKTFADKVESMEFSDILLDSESQSVNTLAVNVVDKSAVVENLDACEYDPYDADCGIVRLTPIYGQTPWYAQRVAPLLYENADVQSVVGQISPPTDVVSVHTVNPTVMLTDAVKETNGRLNINKFSAVRNDMQLFIDDDFHHYRTIIANKLVCGSDRSEGVRLFMRQDALPHTVRGVYPILMSYVLPGKGIVTSAISINLIY